MSQIKIILILCLLAFVPGAFASELVETKLSCSAEYKDGAWEVCEKPTFAVEGKVYSLTQGSDFAAICESLGYNHSKKIAYNPKAVVPAGLKIIINESNEYRLIDETEGCFSWLCLSFGDILIPAKKLMCK